MLDAGWIDEVRGLIERHGADAVRRFPGIGYREIAGAPDGGHAARFHASRDRHIDAPIRQAPVDVVQPRAYPNASDAHRRPACSSRAFLPVLKATLSTSAPPGMERTLLVVSSGPTTASGITPSRCRNSGELVRSAGGEVAEVAIQRRNAPTAPYYIGKGKAEELALLCGKENVGTVIFNDELSPAQSRNLETVFARKILDRTQLILDIFAQRAKSREGKLQIELAQLQYLLPRLTGMWTHLSRQSGGIGTRGPGETQLEVDRRRVQGKDRAAEPRARRRAPAALGSASGTVAPALADRFAGRLHECGQFDAAQPDDELRCLRGG